MKKILLVLLCFLMLGIAASCDQSNSTDEIQSIQKNPDSSSRQQENDNSDNSIDNITEASSVDYSDFNNLPQNYL